jgi:hypothetical protein
MQDIHRKISKKFAEYLSEVPKDIVGNYDFKTDIKTGEQGEDFVKNFLISRGFKFIHKNNDNKYDLLMSYNDNNYTYEIKTDVLLSEKRDTGNLVVEFESRGKPSGVSVCEADYYVYYIPKLKEIWNIGMNDLKNLIASESFRVVVGGDKGSNTKMYLIEREKYKEHFKIYKV